jgi:hypothetical protein
VLFIDVDRIDLTLGWAAHSGLAVSLKAPEFDGGNL